MSFYRRWRQEGGCYFFTVVTFQRRPILTTDTSRHLLRQAIRKTRAERPFELTAIVLLPDHLHTIWRLPNGDADYSTRWRLIKSRYSRAMLDAGYQQPMPSNKRGRPHEKAIWQRRFWEHFLRDEVDLEQHIDYMHYNPVKHGLAQSPMTWPYSTFRDYVARGQYPEDWGYLEPAKLKNWLPPGHPE